MSRDLVILCRYWEMPWMILRHFIFSIVAFGLPDGERLHTKLGVLNSLRT